VESAWHSEYDDVCVDGLYDDQNPHDKDEPETVLSQLLGVNKKHLQQ